jgi:hypothetical protein
MRSDLNLSASAKGEYNQVNVLDRILWRQHDTQEEVHSNQCVILKITDTTIYFNDASDISIFVYTTGNGIHRREDCLQENKWIVSCLQKIYSNILISKNLLLSCKKDQVQLYNMNEKIHRYFLCYSWSSVTKHF